MNKLLCIVLLSLNLQVIAQLTPYQSVNNKYGYKNPTTNNTIIPANYERAKPFNGYYAAVKTVHNWQIIDKAGQVYTYMQSPEIMNGAKPGQFIRLDNKSFSTIDHQGKLLSKTEYDELHYSALLDGILVLKKNNKVGVVRNNGEVLLPMKYEVNSFDYTFNWDGDLYFDDSITFAAKKNGKWGVVNMYGKEFTAFEYDSAHPLMYSGTTCTSLVKKSGKYGIVNEKKELLLPFEYDGYLGMVEGHITMIKNGKVSFHDKNNYSMVKKLPAQKIEEWEDFYLEGESIDIFKINHKGKWGIVNRNSQLIVPIEYDHIFIYSNKATATKGNNQYIISASGEVTEKK